MKIRKILALALVFAFVLAFAAACADDPPPPPEPPPAVNGTTDVTDTTDTDDPPAPPPDTDPYTLVVSWWGGDARHTLTMQMIDLYTYWYPHVTIEPEFASWGDYWTNMMVRAAARDMPDVFLVQLLYLGEFAERGLMLDLGPLTESGAIDVSNFTSGALAASSFNGVLHGITFGDTSPVMIYNRTLIESVGYHLPWDSMSFSEFRDYLVGLQELLPDGYYASQIMVGFDSAIEAFIRQRGGPGFLEADGVTLGYSREMLMEYFQFFYDLYQLGVFPSLEVAAEDAGREWGDSLAGRGRIGFWLTNANQGKIFQAQAPDMEVGMVRFIVADNPTHRYVENVVCSTWAIFPESNHIDGAAHFINTMVNNWELQRIYNMDIGVPGSTVIQQNLIDEIDMTDPVGRMRAREVEIMGTILSTIITPGVRQPGTPIVLDDLVGRWDQIIHGQVSIADAVDAHFSAVAMLLS